jgi:hypothetical protein
MVSVRLSSGHENAPGQQEAEKVESSGETARLAWSIFNKLPALSL